MKPYRDLLLNRLCVLLFTLSCVFIFFRYLGEQLYIMSMVCLFTAITIITTVNHCPNCGTFFEGLKISNKKPNYCRKCGQLIQFAEKKK